MKKISIVVLTVLAVSSFLYNASRIQPGDLTYLGAFRLPDGVPGSDVRSWAWGGSAMTYYPGGDPTGPNDGYTGSIFGAGHAWEHQVSEITIPAPVISASKNLNHLNTASTLQSFRDIFSVSNMEMPRTGLAYLPKQGSQTSDKLHLCWGMHLIDQEEPTHGWCELNLSNPQVKKAWVVDCPHNEYNSNDYLFEIPSAWAAANTPGKLLATGRYRDGGWSGQGPALFAIGPWNQGNPPPNGTSLQYVTLLRYTSTEDFGEESHTMTGYHDSDEWSGAVWLTAGDKAAVVFVGTKGTGDCWYGNEGGPCDTCDNRGWWSTGFEGRFIFYDPDDLAKVAAGTMQPWEPQPYASLNIDQYLYHIQSSQQWYHLGAACFDRSGGFLYVFEPLVDEDKPLIHVWKVNSPGGGGASQGPFGHFSTPLHGSTVRSSVPFTGWALDDVGVESVKIYRWGGGSSIYIGDAVFIEGARPDVEDDYPQYPMNSRAGWGYMMLTNFLPNGGNGTFTFYAAAADNEGNTVTLGTKTITCDNANAVKPFGAIDTPAQGGTASGGSYKNQGWVLTPIPNSIPTDGSTINVYVDGVNLGNPVYNVYRSDVAALFPGYANRNGAGAYFYLDTTAYADGVHSIYWTAADNDGNIDGIGSRYFTIANNSTNSAQGVVHLPPASRRQTKSNPVIVKKGYSQTVEPQVVYPGKTGIITIEIKESERIEIHFSRPTSNLSPLPIGSTFDAERGIFYWQPGPGFIGEYRFIFAAGAGKDKWQKRNVSIKISPKFAAGRSGN